MSLTRRIAEYISTTGLEDFPPDAIDAAKAAITDCLGCALAGSREPLADVLCNYVAGLGGAPSATVIGRRFKTTSLEAALVNGAMSHALDYDDVTFITKTHPSAHLIPGALPLAEELGASGSELLLSYLLGFEVACAVGDAISPAYYDDLGWHPDRPTGHTGSRGHSGKPAASGPGADCDGCLPSGVPGGRAAPELWHHDEAIPRPVPPAGQASMPPNWCRPDSPPPTTRWRGGLDSCGPSRVAVATTPTGPPHLWVAGASWWSRVSRSRNTPAAAAHTWPWTRPPNCCVGRHSVPATWTASTCWWTSTRLAH